MIKAFIICTPGREGVDLRAAGAAIVTKAGDNALKSERIVTPGASIRSIFRRDLIASRRIAR